MAWRFNETVKLELDRREAGALHDALLLLVNEHEDEVEAKVLRSIIVRMMQQIERRK